VQRSRVHLWTHGGDVLEGNKVIIDSSESVAGLQTEHSIVADGVAPQAVSTYKEPETKPAFLGGRSVFARNWPYMYALAPDPKISNIKPDQIGITSIPVSEGNSSSSTLGGWNFFINATSQKQVEAWDFVKFMTSEEGQRQRALAATLLPTRKSLYKDQEVREQVPVMSLAIAEQFNLSLKGETSPEEAVQNLQEELTKIVEQAD